MSESKRNRRLVALAVASALVPARVLAQFDPGVVSTTVPPEEMAVYEQALEEGQEALVAFLVQFPNSPLVDNVIQTLVDLAGPDLAIQLALDAGVPFETVVDAVQVAVASAPQAGPLAPPGAPGPIEVSPYG